MTFFRPQPYYKLTADGKPVKTANRKRELGFWGLPAVLYKFLLIAVKKSPWRHFFEKIRKLIKCLQLFACIVCIYIV